MDIKNKKVGLSLAIALVILAAGFGWTTHVMTTKPTTCPKCELTVNDLQKTFVKIAADDQLNMSQVAGLCDVNGTPILRMFSASWCGHCAWSGPIFDEFAKENADKAIFKHLDVDTGDDSLTPEIETAMTIQDYMLYDQLGQKSIPLFVYGCQYYALGNAFETNNDIDIQKRLFEEGANLVA